ncbi:DUF3135 domain-containing protein [Exilibacterium tricleocarpae]|uniref:DUF3135 domain-containing protein n=1 Tax=Exilibacterium tricleocarpae TaxID=2591008 RepID=A0A545SME7_9GAMM|nr:DUF3135 domain-containing protein [Exilibacterium tricleocarpae]TQV66131.1 DUF3135 domain-containing protein [Exilibacterium tricleocarpae]
MKQSRLPAFDVLVNLAKRDPEALERLRRKEIESVITNAPPHLQRRLRGLQFQIDSQIQIHASPLGACIKISEMMHESFTHLRCVLNELTDQQQPPLAIVGNAAPAEVIPLRRDLSAD